MSLKGILESENKMITNGFGYVMPRWMKRAGFMSGDLTGGVNRSLMETGLSTSALLSNVDSYAMIFI